jgi:hypothetical protein
MAYSELFKYLEGHHGKKAVEQFWVAISDNYLGNLRRLVKEKGLKGMREYWERTLTEEGAKYKMKVSKDSFIIDMLECPSVGILRRAKHLASYPDYCKHCDTLYRRVIEDYGFKYKIEFIDEKLGKCRITISERKS